MKWKNSSDGEPSSWLLKAFFAAFDVGQALVHVHGAAGLAFQGFGHEGGVHIVVEGRLAHGALEEKYLVAQIHGVAVQEIDFHLRRAQLVNQGVHFQILLVAVIVNFFKQGIEFVDRVNGVGTAAELFAAGAADGRHQGNIGVGVLRHQIKFHFRRNHRRQADVFIQLEHAAQHIAWRSFHWQAFGGEAVENQAGGGVLRPGHMTDGAGVGAQFHIGVGQIQHVVAGEIAGNGLDQHHFGQAHFRLR